ncbi:hypothetical protein GCM10022206_61240 [Streptomyces chiangmaiensis]
MVRWLRRPGRQSPSKETSQEVPDHALHLQADIDALAGKETAASPAWTPEKVRSMGEFMGRWTDEPVESGEFVDAAGLAAPEH